MVRRESECRRPILSVIAFPPIFLVRTRKIGGNAMTDKMGRRHSLSRRTMLVGTAGVLGGTVLAPTSVQAQTSAPAAAVNPGSSPPAARYGDPAWWAQR